MLEIREDETEKKNVWTVREGERKIREGGRTCKGVREDLEGWQRVVAETGNRVRKGWREFLIQSAFHRQRKERKPRF